MATRRRKSPKRRRTSLGAARRRKRTSTRCKITRVNGRSRKICRDSKGRITSNRPASSGRKRRRRRR